MSAPFSYCDGCDGHNCDAEKGCAYPGVDAHPSPTGKHAIETRNDEAGFTEVINADVPYIARDIQGPVAILLDVETRAVVGYRVYDAHAARPSPVDEPVAFIDPHSLEYAKRNNGMYVSGTVEKGSVHTEPVYSAATISALEAERDEARERASAMEQTHEREMSRAIREITALRPALTAANARAARLELGGAHLAIAAENFALRFSMNNFAEDDDRQRQAVLDQVRLFRAASA